MDENETQHFSVHLLVARPNQKFYFNSQLVKLSDYI